MQASEAVSICGRNIGCVALLRQATPDGCLQVVGHESSGHARAALESLAELCSHSELQEVSQANTGGTQPYAR